MEGKYIVGMYGSELSCLGGQQDGRRKGVGVICGDEFGKYI